MPVPIVRTFRCAPIWPGVILLPVWLAGFYLAMLDSVIPAPVFVVFGCGVLVFFNRTCVTIDAAEIRSRTGPLPFTASDFQVPLQIVKSTYSREVFRGPKDGGNYFAAGIETAGGEFFDVFAPLATAEEAHREAMELAAVVAAATMRGLDCVQYGVRAIPRDRRAHQSVVVWLLIFLASVLLSGGIALVISK